MPSLDGSSGDRQDAGLDEPSGLESAALFKLLWQTLSEVLGTAATATILRRACKRAAQRTPILQELSIVKSDLAYSFTTPDAWDRDADASPDGLRVLVEELRPLLIELTGPVLVGRLERIEEFQQRGIMASRGEPT
jgi:hypothetical protein